MKISNEQWQQYERDGFLRLGRVLDGADLKALQDEIDAIMLGEANLDYSRILMQLDSETGKYEDAGVQSKGHKGATLNYRKIQDLEFDPLFLDFMQRPIFKEICDYIYGGETPIAAFRAMFMNKPARKGTLLPWHQDRWNYLDRDPQVTVWTALDPASKANGCVQVIPGSHKFGLLNPEHVSGYVSEENIRKYAPDDQIEYLELQAGEAVLLHNWLLHRSDTNATDIPRRAFSVCYMDADTQTTSGETYTKIFGEGAVSPADLQTAVAK
jgi:phytanoyl-CoA hydroxylase